MAIQIQIGPPEEVEEEKPVQTTIELDARKTLDGNIMIFDHQDIDIVVMPAKNKIVALPKDLMNKYVYETQDRLFYFLRKKGIIRPESVHGGNIYGSMEAKIAESINEDINHIQAAVFSIGKFIFEEKPYFVFDEYHDEEVEDLVDPADEDSTELGEVPHEKRKGSMVPGWIRGPYGMSTFYKH
tara:strand:- start:34 stop:585 length:552 start_codon:yes stop_codon:yes gene_type:complete